MSEQSKETPAGQHPEPRRWWRNARRMAWIALTAGVLYPGLLLVTSSSELREIAWPFYTFSGAVVGAYIGFSTADGWGRK